MLVAVAAVPFLHHMPEQVKVVEEIQQQQQQQDMKIQDPVVVEPGDMIHHIQVKLVVPVSFLSHIQPKYLKKSYGTTSFARK
tara:strand:- start:1716 stop:1961 length:246 start_codon:yes stop_codon:yes gene_type:complete